MVDIIVRKRKFSTFNVSFSFSLEGQWSTALKKRGAICMGGVGKGVRNSVPPLLWDFCIT